MRQLRTAAESTSAKPNPPSRRRRWREQGLPPSWRRTPGQDWLGCCLPWHYR